MHVTIDEKTKSGLLFSSRHTKVPCFSITGYTKRAEKVRAKKMRTYSKHLELNTDIYN